MKQETQTVVQMVTQIDEWLRAHNGAGNIDQFAGILRTVIKLAEDNADRGDLKILNRSMQELRHAFRVFAPYRRARKVSIYGSTRVQETDPHYLPCARYRSTLGGSRIYDHHRRRTRDHAGGTRGRRT